MHKKLCSDSPIIGGEPRTVPPRTAPRPRIDMYRLPTRMVALLIVIQTNAHGTIAPTRPGVEYPPTAVGTNVLASL